MFNKKEFYAVEIYKTNFLAIKIMDMTAEQMADALKNDSSLFIQARSSKEALQKAADIHASNLNVWHNKNYGVAIKFNTIDAVEVGHKSPQEVDDHLEAAAFFVQARSLEHAISMVYKKEAQDHEVLAIARMWKSRPSVNLRPVTLTPCPKLPYHKQVVL